MNKNLKKAIEAARFDASNVPKPAPLITIQGRTVCSVSGILALGGLPKSRKSFVLSLMVAAIASGENVLGMNAKAGRVLWIDTEQAPHEFGQKFEMIQRIAGAKALKSDDVFLFRRERPETVLDALHELCTGGQYQYIILDGLTDLVSNVNDFDQARDLLLSLRILTEETQTAILSAIHLSKNSGWTIGALGSAVDRVAESVLTVEKEKDGATTIKSRYMRSDDDFRPFSIVWNDQARAFELGEPAAHSSSGFDLSVYTREKLIERMQSVFAGADFLTYAELSSITANEFGVGLTVAKTRILARLKHEKIISRHTRGQWVFNYAENGKQSTDSTPD